MNHQLRHYHRIIRQLRRAGEQYDAGDIDAMYPASSDIATLIISGKGKTKSLARQLGIESQLELPDTAALGGGFEGSGFPTLCIRIREDCLVASPKSLEIDTRFSADLPTWLGRPICGNVDGQLTRFELVKTMRDNDGGAHVDEQIPDGFYLKLVELGMPRVAWQRNNRGGVTMLLASNEQNPMVHFVENLNSDRAAPIPFGPVQPVHGVASALVRTVVKEVLFALDNLPEKAIGISQ